MKNRHFNLITEPWIKVLDENYQELTVSMEEVLKNARHYRQLAGEMRSQDLVILRLLLAVLLSVYQRVNADGEPYEGLTMDDRWQVTVDPDLDFEDLIEEMQETWQTLYEGGEFSQAVFDYLKAYEDRFDFFGEHAFYQVGREFYDAHVPAKKWIKTGNGKVAVKEINRRVSESNNSAAIFSPRSNGFKNRLSLDEFVRWVITYQNYTGVSGKTSVNGMNDVSKGWLYSISPVYVKGANLFETLMLNLTLFQDDQEKYRYPKPVWEWNLEIYIDHRVEGLVPDNLPELYTVLSRITYIEWNGDYPTTIQGKLSRFDEVNAFIEPMTTWRLDKKGYKPRTKQLSDLRIAMWRNFGDYVGTNDGETRVPGIVWWLNYLTDKGFLTKETNINLSSAGMIVGDDKKSQMPAAEFFDDFTIRADVLFDPDPLVAQRWPRRIEEVIELTKKVGETLHYFAKEVAELRDSNGSGSFANRISAEFYDQLNEPFLGWLASLRNDQDRDEKIMEWKKTLYSLVMQAAKKLVQESSPTEMRGKDSTNIFTLYNATQLKIRKQLS
ncbi:type I-E CRISPR-associated protein Cse1/CasA [Limosilactobacillus fermentum]|nr:type I-E CRISPR-associated protein Cse1/CasA [Limosilactobacillus fermentum]